MKHAPMPLLAIILATGASNAAPVVVDNGYTATPSTLIPAYEDTGGVELTDGDVGNLVWPDPGTNALPLVGWQNIDATATFNFASPVNIGRVIAWFADSDGNAGVGLPESVRITTADGFDQLFQVTNPDGTGTTVGIAMDGFDVITDSVTLHIARDKALDNPVCCDGNYEWTMLSEVQFFTPIDPNSPALIAPTTVDLGTIPNKPTAIQGQFSISNSNEVNPNLNIADVSFGGQDAGNFMPGSHPATLMPGESGEVTFTFDSGGIPGDYSARLEVDSDAPDSPTSVEVLVSVNPPLPPRTPYQEAVLADNPLLYWTFDEEGDTDAARSLVNDVPQNELIARGSATRAPSTTTAGGLGLGRAASFDGGSATRFDALDLSDTLLPTTGISQFALEIWFQSDATSAQYLMETFTETGTSNESSLIFGFNAHMPDEFEIFSGDRSGTPIAAPNSWHHAVVAHYGAGDVEIIVDGVSTTVTGDYDSTQTFGRIAVGATVLAPTNGFIGLIDEFAIYDLTNFADDAERKAHVRNIAEHHSQSDDSDRLRITGIAREPGNKIRLTWNSNPNQVYTIFWSTDLANFETDVSDNFESQGTTTSHSFDNPTVDFDNPTGSPNLFFIVGENE